MALETYQLILIVVWINNGSLHPKAKGLRQHWRPPPKTVPHPKVGAVEGPRWERIVTSTIGTPKSGNRQRQSRRPLVLMVDFMVVLSRTACG